jgi:hypothetical protein
MLLENINEQIVMDTIAEIQNRQATKKPSLGKDPVFVRAHIAFVRAYFRRRTVRPLTERHQQVRAVK